MIHAVMRTAGFALLIAFPWLTVFAQTPVQLGLDEAIKRGLESSKYLHASQMKSQYADARSREVNASRLPSLKFSGGYTRLSDIDPFVITLPIPGVVPNTFTLSPNIVNTYSLKGTLVQPLFTGFKLENSVAAAEYTADAARADVVKDKSETIYAIKNAYWSLYKAGQLKEVVDQNVEMVEAHLHDAENLLEQGLLTTNDVLKIKVQLSNTKLLQIDVKNGVQLALVSLNSLLSLPLTTQIVLTTEIRHDPTVFDQWSVLVDRALHGRSDIRAMDLRVKAGEAGVGAARGGWWPQIMLVGNYTSARPNQRIVPLVDAFTDTWDVSLMVSLDVWNWGTTAHQTQQAQAQLEQAHDALGALKDGATLEVTQTYLSMQQAKEKIDVARQSVEQAEENSRITSEKFKEGVALTTDVLDADVALLQAKTNYTQSLVDYELAQARLLKSIGEDNQ